MLFVGITEQIGCLLKQVFVGTHVSDTADVAFCWEITLENIGLLRSYTYASTELMQ